LKPGTRFRKYTEYWYIYAGKVVRQEYYSRTTICIVTNVISGIEFNVGWSTDSIVEVIDIWLELEKKLIEV